MKRVLRIILSHLLLFFIVFAYQAQAHAEEEEWTIDSLETMAYARVSGEVIHGDNLNFFINDFLAISTSFDALIVLII